MDTLKFITEDFFIKAASIPADKQPLWGKMNPQQMVEHLVASVRIANGSNPHSDIVTPADRLPAVQDFLRGDRDFKPNTRNAMMGDEPPAVAMADLPVALTALKEEVQKFVELFSAQPGLLVRNPFFGDLGFEDWSRLFHKHFLHHLRQFQAD
ncbi:MAG: DUF1569 domain-containing protein [Bacteroidota bacterium]